MSVHWWPCGGRCSDPRVFRDRSNPLGFSDEYLCSLLEPRMRKHTHRSQALTTVQSVCIALCFFACGIFLYSVGDAEGLVEATVCREIRRVYLALKQYLNIFITFPSGDTENQGGFLFSCRYVTVKTCKVACRLTCLSINLILSFRLPQCHRRHRLHPCACPGPIWTWGGRLYQQEMFPSPKCTGMYWGATVHIVSGRIVIIRSGRNVQICVNRSN